MIAYFARELVHITGDGKEFTRGSALGTTVTTGFCPNCGSTIYVKLEKNPTLVGVPVGAFGDNNFSPPNIAVWGQEQHRWLEFPDTVPCFAQGTD